MKGCNFLFACVKRIVISSYTDVMLSINIYGERVIIYIFHLGSCAILMLQLEVNLISTLHLTVMEI